MLFNVAYTKLVISLVLHLELLSEARVVLGKLRIKRFLDLLLVFSPLNLLLSVGRVSLVSLRLASVRIRGIGGPLSR